MSAHAYGVEVTKKKKKKKKKYGPEGVLYSSRGLCPRNMSTVSLLGSSSIGSKVDWCINRCRLHLVLHSPTHRRRVARAPGRTDTCSGESLVRSFESTLVEAAG